MKTLTKEALLARANKPAEDALRLHADIVPRMDEWEVFPREAAVTGMKAQERVARLSKTWDQLCDHAPDELEVTGPDANHLRASAERTWMHPHG